VSERSELGILLDVANLHASYGAVEVLRGIDLRVREGEIVALLGTNGAGKSTILRCISGLMGTDAGSITFEGRDVTGVPTEDTVRAGITQVPGGRGLLPNLSVEENLRMGAYPVRHDRGAVKAGYDRVYEVFPRLGERRKQLAGLMSGGEQQMLAIGRALMLQPKLMMIDELSLGLAPIVVQHLVEVVKEINASGVAMSRRSGSVPSR
jgi:branched-chain amino acid transport system ATP-binding protein